MHIPDGFLTNRIALSMDVLSGATVLLAAHRLKLESAMRLIPMMGVFSSFVFAAQMLNFPVFGGTSGHLVGGALVGILLGPMAGLLTMATVIIAQALFLQDGGLVALGANLFNIGAVSVLIGYTVYRLFGSPEAKGKRLSAAGFVAGWFSVVVSAAACALELGLSGAVPLKVGLPAMAGYHAVIGLVEGGLTAGVLSFLVRARPDFLKKEAAPRFGFWDGVGGLILVAIPLAFLALAGSSSLPDPLQALLPEPVAGAIEQESILSPGRADDLNRVLLYIGILVVGAIALLAARRLTSRGRPS